MAAPHEEFARSLEALARRAPTAFLVAAPNGVVEYANLAAAILFGTDAAALVGTPLTRWIPEGSGERHRPVAAFECAGRTAQDDTIPVEVTIVPLDDGSARSWILIQDITRRRGLEGSIRRHAEELEKVVTSRTRALQDLHVRHRGLYDLAPILDFEIDSEGAIASANRMAFLALGVPIERLVGVPLTEVAAPDQREVVREAMERARTGIAAPFETRLRSADGSMLDVAFHPMQEDGGARGTLRLLGLDLTARREAERLVDQSLDLAEAQRARMERILRGIGEGVVVTDPDGQVRLMNSIAERLLGIEERWAFGRDLFSEQGDARFSAGWADFLAGGDETATLELSPSEGNARLAVTLSRIRTPEGRPAGYVAALRDVSADRRAEQLQRELIANVAHELRAPLASIRGFTASLAAADDMAPRESQHLLAVVEKEADRLFRLVDDLLALSRLDAGRESVRTQDGDAAALVAGIAETYTAIAQDRGLTLVSRGEGTGLFDVEKVRRVFDYLVGHAMRCTPPGGEIGVELLREGGRLVGAVRDTGRGIGPQEIERVFARFSTTGGASGVSSGTGLGLAIAKKLVEVSGGTIEAESRLGEGTTFRFWIPATPAHRGAGPRTQGAARGAEGGEGSGAGDGEAQAAAGAAAGAPFVDALVDDPDEDFASDSAAFSSDAAPERAES